MTVLPLSYLLLSDFDGTMAKTFDPNPHNIGVHKAYEIALCQVFGERVLLIYHELGGLQNRDPESLVTVLLDNDPSLRIAGRTIKEMAEQLVQYKLEVLLQEIGPMWPLPCDGFREFADQLTGVCELGIVSSGHTQFIQRTLHTWGISCPQVMVTDDDTRYLDLPLLARVKPAPYPFELAMTQWLDGDRSRVIYFGDDPVKDGGLACNVDVPFGLFTNGQSTEADFSSFPTGSFQFSNWREIAEFILARAEDFWRGRPCSEIFQDFR